MKTVQTTKQLCLWFHWRHTLYCDVLSA